MSKRMALASILIASFLGGAGAASAQAASAADEVRAAERAFAKTMADRDHAAFGKFVARDAVFFGQKVLHGREEVVAGWKPFFDGPAAPFSWDPETVEVLASGGLAHSSGPVLDPKGNRVGTFNSVWRKEADGQWRVVFDKGCNCK